MKAGGVEWADGGLEWFDVDYGILKVTVKRVLRMIKKRAKAEN